MWEVLHDQPNPTQTSYEFREMLMAHVALRGNGYAEIIPTAGNPVAELIPLHPDRVRPFWAPDKTVAYRYQPLNGPSRIILGAEMFHVRGLGFDGLSGMSPIRLHRETIGEDFAAQEYSARFWANDATPSGVLKIEGTLGDEAQARLRKSWEEQQTGANRHRPALLEDGLEYEAIGLTREDAQYVESRKFTGLQIARMFRIQPHLVGILDRATFSNIEAQGIEFVVYTMGPWLRRWEQAARRDLFTAASRRTHFSEFLVDGLLRGDRKARSEFYKTAIINGWMSRNEVRRRENLNRRDGLDEFLVPLNMTLSDALAQMIEDKLSDADAGGETAPQRSNGKGRLADHR
ncbi:MAG: phage portal protein [Armatimonadetes bacterium]|nr:phage portal protein [Armatimonadota bacterium]